MGTAVFLEDTGTSTRIARQHQKKKDLPPRAARCGAHHELPALAVGALDLHVRADGAELPVDLAPQPSEVWKAGRESVLNTGF